MISWNEECCLKKWLKKLVFFLVLLPWSELLEIYRYQIWAENIKSWSQFWYLLWLRIPHKSIACQNLWSLMVLPGYQPPQKPLICLTPRLSLSGSYYHRIELRTVIVFLNFCISLYSSSKSLKYVGDLKAEFRADRLEFKIITPPYCNLLLKAQ